MRICIVGGIFDKPIDYQNKHILTPETYLANGLRAQGFEVDTAGHSSFYPNSHYDIVHVHHLGKAAVRMSLAETNSVYVFTGHDGVMMCHYKVPLLRKLAFWFVLNRADGVIALSKREKDYLGKSRRKKLDNVYLIRNGIDTDIFKKSGAEKKRKNARFSILYVGQLIPLKGIDILLKAVNIISHMKQVELWLVYQNAMYEEYYKKMAIDLGIIDSVKFIGFVSSIDLPKLYQTADVFVLPSYAESLPSTIIEAMLCGTPIIATNVGGIPEQISGVGKMICPGNVDQLVAAINEVEYNIDHFRRLATEAIPICQRKFCVDAMIKRHIQVYRRLLAGKKKHHSWLNKHFDSLILKIIEEYLWRGSDGIKAS